MPTDAEMVPAAGGNGGAVATPEVIGYLGTVHSSPDRAFLNLQETCLRNGLIEEVAASVPRLAAIAKDTSQSRRTRMRAEGLLQALARHVIPAPGKGVSIQTTGPTTIIFDSPMPEAETDEG